MVCLLAFTVLCFSIVRHDSGKHSREVLEYVSYLVKLEWRRGGVVKNGQKLKKGSFSLIKTLTLEMSPIGMKQETRKKN